MSLEGKSSTRVSPAIKSHSGFLFTSIAAALLIAGTSQAEFHQFTSFGVPFAQFAELVAVDGNKVVLRNSSGDMAVVPMDLFTKTDKDYVAQVQAARTGLPQRGSPQKAPAEPKQPFRPIFEATCTTEKTQSHTDSPIFHDPAAEKVATFETHIKVRNTSSQPTGALELYYQLCVSTTDNSSETGDKNMTVLNYKTGMLPCPPLAPGASITLDTPPFALRSQDTRSAPGIVRVVNGKTYHYASQHRDEYKGIIIVIKSNGVPVFEYVTPGVKKYP